MFILDLEFDPDQVDLESAIMSLGTDDFIYPITVRELDADEKQGTEWPVVRLTCAQYTPLKVIASYYDRTYALYSDSMVDFIVES